jgi:hypothetical protein
MRKAFIEFFEQWRGAGADLNAIYELLDRYPGEWVASTYFNRFSNDEVEKELYAEQVILPYCIERGLIKKKKGKYVLNEDAEQMPELDFSES